MRKVVNYLRRKAQSEIFDRVLNAPLKAVKNSFDIKLDYEYQWIYLKWRLDANSFLNADSLFSIVFFYFDIYIYTLSVLTSSVLIFIGDNFRH